MSLTASTADQLRLLDVQALDTSLAQLAHRRRTLPETAALAALDARSRVLRDELVAARTVAGDVDREAVRAEADVEQVRAREERNAARLAAGTGTAKDLQALQKDSEALARRQGDLEEVQLEVMERQEQAAAAVAAAQARLGAVEDERAQVAARRDAALADSDRQAQLVRAQRVPAVAGLDAELLALYDRVRAAEGGLGAAPLLGDRCGGCRLQLTPVELGRVRSAPAGEVLRCEECGRILVRVPERAPELHR